MAAIDVQLLAQLKTWNPWWQQGKEGICIEKFRLHPEGVLRLHLRKS